MTIFTFALKRIFKDKTNLIFLTLFPVAAIFLPEPEYWPLLPYGYHYFGVLILFVGIRLTGLLVEDRQKGVVKRLAAAPVTHFQYLFQNLLAFSVIVIAQCIFMIAGGVIYDHELHEPLLLLILFIVFSFTAIALSLAWNSLYRNKETSFLVFMCVIIIMALLGGIMMPIEMLPDVLEQLAVIFPTYWLAEGMEWVVMGEDTADFLLINGVLLLYTLLFLIIGSIRRMG
ncbi:ABC transporter permease [Natribacillus halophilus]|uniref:ABC-2 type transport system permease protein n=1 Tax=Natribacillus halophilus TaxID=549003 RepID=A0A1G8S266_9BACI|nr:ABC transporter permease [Natribacillus halophilus]SDJ23309.1 ABC-2 type transport system permease protein [Natribacillus halophilus]